ncbi:prephenate dehydrogenase [Nakamurella silvestris]|nr:prephenate dehydrogenase [Nakamurella silvestris]
MPPICVIGLGQIGGSLMKAAQPLTTVFGQSRSDSTRSAARAEGFDVLDTVESALERAREVDALVVLATPIPAFPQILDTVNRICPTVRLTDVGSIKGIVDDQVAEHAPAARFIGSHPMCGTQFSGWSASSADLFTDAVWVTALTENSAVADWSVVARLALAIGSRVVPADPRAHDDAVARISHLPHLLALTLAQVAQSGGALALALAAGSFADATRVAATRPELIRAMTEPNSEALIGATDELLGLLGVARGSLASSGSLRTLTENGHLARSAYESRSEQLGEFALSGADLIEELQSVGAAGGYVYAIEGDAKDPLVRVRYPDEV